MADHKVNITAEDIETFKELVKLRHNKNHKEADDENGCKADTGRINQCAYNFSTSNI